MWFDVEQNTDEWFELRKGHITSSKFNVIMVNAFDKDKKFVATRAFNPPAVKYAQKLALERVTGRRREDNYTSKAMDDGHIYEPIARELYEIEKLYEVTNGGYNELGWIGDSPDGNVGANGCIEIKCVISDTQWERLKKGGIDNTYKWQIQGHLWLGDKDWCDFVSYCHASEFVDDKRLYIHRVERDYEMIHQLIMRANEFNKLINKHIQILKQ